VYAKGSSGFDEIHLDNTPSLHQTFSDFLMNLLPSERWCTDYLSMEDQGITIAHALQHGEAVAVLI
jgi:hypothetical protein